MGKNPQFGWFASQNGAGSGVLAGFGHVSYGLGQSFPVRRLTYGGDPHQKDDADDGHHNHYFDECERADGTGRFHHREMLEVNVNMG